MVDTTDDAKFAELQAANPDVKLEALDAYGFFAEGDEQVCLLPPGHRFVALVAGRAPHLLPECDPGEWVFTCPALPKDSEWPQLLMVVVEDHVRGVLNMGGDQTRELVRMIARGKPETN
jgi:hypothetical protein